VRRRVRHHVNPLGVKFLDTAAVRVETRARPLEVELGCADARFLFERAPKHPDVDFVGVEIRKPLVDTVNEQAAEAGLSNLRAVFANITTELDILFADASLRRVFVNFPDPWFKQRHAKRRLMTAELAHVIARKLEPGGELLFQSDIWTLGIEALVVLEGEPTLANERGAWSFLRENPYDAKSLREVRVEENDVRVWRMLFRRIGAARSFVDDLRRA
jgi:tRNA (guanine-N7-)-methyltransferase